MKFRLGRVNEVLCRVKGGRAVQTQSCASVTHVLIFLFYLLGSAPRFVFRAEGTPLAAQSRLRARERGAGVPVFSGVSQVAGVARAASVPLQSKY